MNGYTPSPVSLNWGRAVLPPPPKRITLADYCMKEGKSLAEVDLKVKLKQIKLVKRSGVTCVEEL